MLFRISGTYRALTAKAPLRRLLAVITVSVLVSAGLIVGDFAQKAQAWAPPGGSITGSGVMDQNSGWTMSPDGSKAFVGGGSNLSVFDLNAKTLLAVLAVGGMQAFQWSADGTMLYATNGYSVAFISATGGTPSLANTINLSPNGGTSSKYGMKLSADGSNLYVANSKGLVKVPTSGQSPVLVAANNGSWSSVLLSQDGTTAYVGSNSTNGLQPINLSTNTVGATITTSIPVGANAVSSDGNFAFLWSALGGNQGFYKFNLSTGTLSSLIATTTYAPYDIAISGDGSTASVVAVNASAPTTGSGYIYNYTASSMSLITSGGIHVGPRSVVLNNDGSRAFYAGIDGSANSYYNEFYVQYGGAASSNNVSAATSVGIMESPDGLTTYTLSSGSSMTLNYVGSPYVSPQYQTQTITLGQAITPTLPLNSYGLTGTITWSANSRASGLSIDPVTGVLSGTPNFAGYYDFNIQASNGLNQTFGFMRLRVTSLTPATQTINAYAGQAITSTPTFSSGGLSGSVTYSISPALPVGLSIASGTGVISGTPRLPQAAATYTVTATGATGGSDTATVTIQSGLITPQNTQYVSAVAGTPITPTSVLTGQFISGTPNWTTTSTIPTGLSLDATTGVISGTPTTAANWATINLKWASPSGDVTRQVAVGVASPGATLSNPGPITARVGTAITPVSSTASGFSGTPTFGLLNSPIGIAQTNGVISGAQTLASMTSTTSALTQQFLLKASYSTTEFAYVPISFYSSTSGASITMPSSLTLGQGQAMTPSAAPTVSGLTGPIGYWISPSLPDGLTMNGLTGVISGTPTTQTPARTYTVTAIGSATTLDKAVTTFSLAVTGTLSPSTQTIYASEQVQISDTSTFTSTGVVGTPTYTVSPALPLGLALSSNTGVISGSPQIAQPLTNYTITSTGSTSGTATATVSISVAGISPYDIARTIVKNVAMSPTTGYTAVGFVGAVTYAISPSLPAGLAFNTSTGVISGTPTVSGENPFFTVTATGATAGVGTANVTLDVAELPPATTSVQGTVGSAITPTTAYQPIGLVSPITYTVSPALPAGLAINASTGVISGTPTTALASTTYTVTATDARPTVVSTTLTIQIAGLSPVAQTRSIQLGAAISDTTALTPTGFTGAVSYSVSPSVASGLSFNTATGVISGTPTVALAGVDYTITAQGATAGVATATVTMRVAAISPTTQSLVMRVGSASQTQVLTPSGFSGVVTYSVSPTLPTGIALNTSTGVISGTPTDAQGATNYTITATGSLGGQAQTVITLGTTLNVTPALQTVAAAVGRAITPTAALTVVGGSGSTVFTVAPSLPAGLSLNPSTGVISGTPTAPSARSSFSISATDAVVASKVGAVSVSIAVDALGVALTPASQSIIGEVNAAITATTPMSTTGVVGAVSYLATPGLPAGLTLDSSTGVISGTPTSAQPTSTHLITATGATSGSATATISISVSSVNAYITPTQQTINGRVGTALIASTSFTTTGLTGSVSFTVAPALPAGLSLNSSTGVVSGTPTTATAALPYVITATGATSGTVSANVTLGIASATATVANASQVIQAEAGQAITASAPLNASGLTGTVTYSISPQLPAGMSFNSSTGVISGTPLTPLSGVTFTVTASGSTSGVATGIVTLTVATAGASVSSPTQAVITPAGSAITPSVAPTTTGMTGPFTYMVSPLLPAGLVLDPATGVISGTPTSGLPATEFAVTVIDSNGDVASFSTVIAVSSSGTTASPSSQQSVGAAGSAITATAPVSTTGLSGTPRFTVTPVLPAGLVLDPATGVISGTPTSGFAPTVFTITGSGATSGVVSVPVTLAANSSGATVTPATANIIGTVNSAITATSVLTVSGVGSNPVFTVSPELPTGLSLASATGVVSGTPTSAQQAQTYLITATGSTGVVNHQLTIAVSSAGATLTPATQTISGQTGNAITATSSLTASGLTGSASYTISPALPAGLSLNASTGVISGTPTVTQVQSTFVITGIGATSGIATSAVTITVAGISPSTQTVQGSVGQVLTATSAFNSVGISGVITYAVSPSLPAGLALNTSTGVISGTPTTAQSSASYTITGTGSVAGSATATVSIQLAGLSPANQSVQATYGSSMTPTTSLTATGFIGAVSYSVSPSLPTGLSLNSSTGVVSGTPTQVPANTSYTLAATGATAGTATASLNLSVAAIAPAAPSAITVTMVRGQAIVSWTAGDTGGSAVTYTVTTNPGGFTCTSTQSSCVIPGLTAGTNYTFNVVAGSSAGSATPAPSSPTTAQAPTVPQNLPTATGGSSISVTDMNGNAVTAMEIGRSYIVSGTGFAPNSDVTLLFYSTPTQVGTAAVNGQGSFSKTVVVPSTLPTGSHHLAALGVASNASEANALVSVTVAEPSLASDLARTGADFSRLLALAVLLLLMGGAAMIIRRRPIEH